MIPNPLNHEVLATDITSQMQAHKNFLDEVVRDDAFLDASQKDVVLAEHGTLPEVSIDDNTALSIQSRQDIVTSYRLRSYRTKPVLIRNFEQYFTDYEKQKHISSEQAIQLKEAFASRALYEWAFSCSPTAKKLTTGTARKSSYGSGNVKSVTFKDLLEVKKQLARDTTTFGEKEDQLIGLINANMYADIVSLSQVQNGHYTVQSYERGGSVLHFMGIRFELREDLPAYLVSGITTTLKDYSATLKVTHSAGALFFHKRLVRSGISSPVRVYADVSASYGGLALSSEIRAGASVVRTDKKGVVVLIESNA